MGGAANEGGADLELLGEDCTALILVEANLEVPPTFQLRRTDPNRRVAEFSNTLVNEEGERVQQHWRISVPEPYELPGPLDQDVWVAVQALVGMRGGMPPDGVLYFSLYELLGVMRRVRNGDNYRDLRASLLRLSATHFQADNAFYLKDKNKMATRTFTLWDVSLDTEVDNRTGDTTERHFLEFHNVVRQSFRAEYLKTLDSDFYFSLRSPLAKRLYRIVDRKRQGRLRWGTSLDKLKGMAPLAPSYKTPSKIRDVLKTAHRELQRREFLAGVSYEKRNGVPWVRYRVEPEFDRLRSLSAAAEGLALGAEPTEDERRAIALLAREGVWANVARDLVRRHGPERCCSYVESLYLQKGIEDSGAWLRWAIETGSALPNHLRTQPRLLDGSEPPEDTASPPWSTPPPHRAARPAHPAPEPAARELWTAMLDDVASETDASLVVWLEGVVPTALENETLTLCVPNAFAKEYIEARFKPLIERALQERLSGYASLKVSVAQSDLAARRAADGDPG